MSVEYVKRITIKKDGVYLCTKSNNDSMPYRSVRINSLSEIYREEGQEGLDKELVAMFMDYCVPKGYHKSIMPFRRIYANERAIEAAETRVRNCNAEWAKLSEEDKRSRYVGHVTSAMKEYMNFEKVEKQKYIDVLYGCLLLERAKEE